MRRGRLRAVDGAALSRRDRRRAPRAARRLSRRGETTPAGASRRGVPDAGDRAAGTGRTRRRPQRVAGPRLGPAGSRGSSRPLIEFFHFFPLRSRPVVGSLNGFNRFRSFPAFFGVAFKLKRDAARRRGSETLCGSFRRRVGERSRRVVRARPNLDGRTSRLASRPHRCHRARPPCSSTVLASITWSCQVPLISKYRRARPSRRKPHLAATRRLAALAGMTLACTR